MDEKEKHIRFLFYAELQFRLASAVRIATTLEQQPLDLPMEWTHDSYRVRYEEIALRQDQGEEASAALHHTATFTMSIAIKDAIEAVIPGLAKSVQEKDIEKSVHNTVKGVTKKMWICPDMDVITAYHIARLIRNAYAHSPFLPKWMIHKDLREKVFTIPEVMQLKTKNLHGTQIDWGHYGGPIAMFQFCRFVRTKILGHNPDPRKEVPIPTYKIYQMGDLIMKEVDDLPLGAIKLNPDQFPDGKIPLGEDNFLVLQKKKNSKSKSDTPSPLSMDDSE